MVIRTDRPNMTIAVDWSVKQQNKQTNNTIAMPVRTCYGTFSLTKALIIHQTLASLCILQLILVRAIQILVS